MTVVELTAGDFARVGLAAGSEGLLGLQAIAAIRAAFATWVGVGPGGVIVFPFSSLQPVPKPLQHQRDGRGRLPPGVTTDGARHPVWWLDAHTKWRDADEDELGYGARLTSELADRGLHLPGHGPVDVLASRLGWPPGDPEGDRRIRAYAEGGWDPELSRLEIGPRPGAGSGGAVRRQEHKVLARTLLAPRLALLEVAQQRLEAGDRRARDAEQAVVAATDRELAELAATVIAAAAALARGARADRRTVLARRATLASAVEAMTGRLERHERAAAACCGRPAADAGELYREAARVVGLVQAGPADDERLAALVAQLERWRLQAAGTAHAARHATIGAPTAGARRAGDDARGRRPATMTHQRQGLPGPDRPQGLGDLGDVLVVPI